MRKALVVGIDHYAEISSLHGCVNDAHAVKNVLEANACDFSGSWTPVFSPTMDPPPEAYPDFLTFCS